MAVPGNFREVLRDSNFNEALIYFFISAWYYDATLFCYWRECDLCNSRISVAAPTNIVICVCDCDLLVIASDSLVLIRSLNSWEWRFAINCQHFMRLPAVTTQQHFREKH